MDNLKDPMPIREANTYLPPEKPEWKLKPLIRTTFSKLPYYLELKFKDPSQEKPGVLIYSSSIPSSVEEIQTYFNFLVNDEPSHFNEHTYSDEIRFSSYIESGNLQEVYSELKDEYNLYLRSDSNTQGQTQWFYFSVENKESLNPIRLNICNIRKSTPMYRKGLKPWVFSESENQFSGKKWHMLDGEVEYFRNPSDSKLFTLSFTYNFSTKEDKVFFAFTMPYTYTKLQKMLREIEWQASQNQVTFICEDLCRSVAGLSVPKVYITAPESGSSSLLKRKAVILCGRVHPCETHSSYVLEGILKFLVSDNVYASSLRENFIFYIIPMLNPDGVVFGNSRTGLSGVDLNRRWENPDEYLHPTIFHAKRMIKAIQSKREVLLFCDFHAHSKKEGSFIYGCNLAANGRFTSWTKVRLFPRIIAGITPYFSFENCKFRVEAQKQGTGRIVLWKNSKITNSFTLETSVLGYKYHGNICHFNMENLRDLGYFVMIGLYEYRKALKSVEFEMKINGGWLKPNRLKSLSGTPANINSKGEVRQNKLLKLINSSDWRKYFEGMNLEEEKTNEDPESSGSDSCPSDDNLSECVSLSFPSKTKLKSIEGQQKITSRRIMKAPSLTPSSRLRLDTPLYSCWIHNINLDLERNQRRSSVKTNAQYVKKASGFFAGYRNRIGTFKSPVMIRSYRNPETKSKSSQKLYVMANYD